MFFAFFLIALASIAYGKTGGTMGFVEESISRVFFKFCFSTQIKFKRNYDDEEDVKRFEIFKDKVAFIEVHNEKYEKGEVTFKAGIN